MIPTVPMMKRVLTLLLLAGGTLSAQGVDESRPILRHPLVTAAGLVCTDNFATAIYLQTPDRLETLVSSPGCGQGMTISPDGRAIGFKQILAEGVQTAVLFNVTTRQTTSLGPSGDRIGQPSFAADGTIAYTSGEELVLLHGASSHRVSLGTYANTAPISPDARLVVFNDDADQLWILDLASGERHRITDGSHSCCEPLWSPDGSRLFYRTLGGEGRILSLATGEAIALGQAASPSWSKDGQTLVFQRAEIADDVFIDSDLFAVRPATGRIDRLTNTRDVAEVDPVFVDNGKTLAYVQLNQPVLMQQHILTTDGRVTLLASPEASVAYPVKPAYGEPPDVLAKRNSTTQLDVPYVHQCYDTPDWHNGNSSCAPTAAIMVLAYYNILPPWPTYCSTPSVHYNNWGNYVAAPYYFRGVNYGNYSAGDASSNPAWGGYGYMWAGSGSPSSRMAGYYLLHGLTATRTADSSYAVARAQIDAGRPFSICCLLTTAGHLVVAHGLGAEQHTLVFNDPYGNKNQGYKNYNGKNASYDWPGYNNGFQNLTTVAWSVATSFSPPACVDTLVDDCQFGRGFVLKASAPASMEMYTDQLAGIGSHSWKMKSTTADTCSASWTTTLSRPGTYRVEAYIPPSSTGIARYLVTSGSGTVESSIDQGACADSWTSLGTFAFTGPAAVSLGSGSSIRGAILGIDAVRWAYQGTAGIPSGDHQIPFAATLDVNYPNPFNSRTIIPLRLTQAADVRMTVHDLLGRQVAELTAAAYAAGDYRIAWDASGHATGIYICRLVARSASRTTSSSRVLVYLK